MRKLITLIVIMVILSACSNTVNESERKETMTDNEVMETLEVLLDPYLETQDAETEKEVDEVMEKIKEVATNTKRTLKKDSEKDIHAVDDLVELSDLLISLYGEYEEGNVVMLQAHGKDIGSKLHKIAEEYT